MREDGDEIIPTRASLLHRLKDWRDQASWQQFFDIYWKLIYGVARQAGLTDAESQDVVQDTMLSVARHMPNFKYDAANGQFKTWLLNMTRWRIVDHVRKRARTPQNDPGSPPEAQTGTIAANMIVDPTGNVLDKIWEAEWHETVLRAAVASIKRRVDPLNYQLFDFYVNKEWPPAKVASAFNVAVDQVYLAKHRVTEMLKQEVARLEREGA
jgi:RNA polymerase sigma-70 factor (ECF subfamily)